MNKEILKDGIGRLLGSVVTESNGSARAYNARGQLVGRYDAVTKQAWNDSGQLVGRSIGSIYGLVR
jgi:YD repeat-containing protein